MGQSVILCRVALIIIFVRRFFLQTVDFFYKGGLFYNAQQKEKLIYRISYISVSTERKSSTRIILGTNRTYLNIKGKTIYTENDCKGGEWNVCIVSFIGGTRRWGNRPCMCCVIPTSGTADIYTNSSRTTTTVIASTISSVSTISVRTISSSAGSAGLWNSSVPVALLKFTNRHSNELTVV